MKRPSLIDCLAAACVIAWGSLALQSCRSGSDMMMSPSGARPLSETEQGPYKKVQRIVDGDTIVVAHYGTVRLLGVDTPELHHPTKPVERCAFEAAEFIGKLIGNENVRLSFQGSPKKNVYPRDRYGRVLAYVWRYGLIQTKLLEAGLARSYPTPHPRKEAFDFMERRAKEQRKGMWGDVCKPVPVASTLVTWRVDVDSRPPLRRSCMVLPGGLVCHTRHAL